MSSHTFGETTIQDWEHSPDDRGGKTYHLTVETRCSCGDVVYFTTGKHKDRSDAHIAVQFEMMKPILEVLKNSHLEMGYAQAHVVKHLVKTPVRKKLKKKAVKK